jgi:c(7)-type cytochrome triheme protein
MLVRIVLFSFALTAFLAGAGMQGRLSVVFAPKTPKEIVFPSKQGNVPFNHALHSKRVKNNCKVCHDKLFPESSAPMNYKAAEHKTAETARTSCGGCHYPGGDAFEAKGNCAKCHIKS